MSDSEDSIITYIAMSTPFRGLLDIGSPGVDRPPVMPEDPYAYVVAAFQAPPSPDYVSEDDILPAEEQPLPATASPTTESPGYIDESDHKDDPEEDLTDYPADGGDEGDDEDESSDDDEDDDIIEGGQEEDEYLASAESIVVALPAVDHAPSDEETEPFETDDSAATPPPHPAYRATARMSIRPQTPISLPSDTEIARLMAIPTPPPSPLSPLSSPLPHIPSPPLPLLSPSPTDPTYEEVPLGYMAAKLHWRAEREEILEADLPLRKRLCTTHTCTYELGESSTATAARLREPVRDNLYRFVDIVERGEASTRAAREVGYGITDTWDDLKLPVCYDDDDDEESSNSLEDNIISELPSYSVVTPSEPIDSLSMGDEHLNTIPATKSDEFIKSYVENLVLNPSESEGENKCDVPASFTTFSNVLFDADYDFDSGDDQSISDEDVPEKIYSNPLFDEEIIPMEIDQHSFNVESDLIRSMPNHDSSITISSKIDSLFDEFAGELTLLKSIPPGIDDTDCHPAKETRFSKRLLYDNSSPHPPKEIVSENSNADIESFSASPIPNKDSDSRMKEIDLSFTPNDPMLSGVEEDDDDSERDLPILEEFIDNYSISLPANESYHFDIPSPYRPPAKPPDGNTGTLNIKMMGDVSDQKVPIPNLTITLVLNQEKSPDLLPHQGFEAFQPSAECPMIINGKNIPLL
nr:hypothetical protein [Tanacetum cinerariifolium]